MDNSFDHIPAVECVRKVGAAEGEEFDVAGAHLVWKVKGDDSAHSFSVCGLTLAPSEWVPLHSHISAESFYVLSGSGDFFRLVGRKEDWVRCETENS